MNSHLISKVPLTPFAATHPDGQVDNIKGITAQIGASTGLFSKYPFVTTVSALSVTTV
jgi:hypothetical protein